MLAQALLYLALMLWPVDEDVTKPVREAPPRYTIVEVREGDATRYARGVFETVWRDTRQYEMQECDECVGYVALLYKSDLGKRVMISHEGRTVGPVYVIDVAPQHTIADRLQRGWVADISFEVAQMLGGIEAHEPVRIYILQETGPKAN